VSTYALNGQYLLLLSANSVEKKALNAILKNRRDAIIGFATKGCSIGLLGNRFTIHLTGECGFTSPHSIGRLVTQLFAADTRIPTPALVILAGFGWGHPLLTGPNSVMAATSVCLLNNRCETEQGTEYRGRWLTSPLEIEERVINLLNSQLHWRGVRVIQGPMASLETLFKSDAARNELLN
jgi:hypothetical protein